MARARNLRIGAGELSPSVAGEANADGTDTLILQAEQYPGTVTITNGQSLSPAIDTGGRRLAAILIPAGGWTAAILSFQASTDGITYGDLYDDSGNEAQVQAAAGRMVALDVIAMLLAPFRYVKIRSGATGAPVVQAADRVLQYMTRGS